MIITNARQYFYDVLVENVAIRSGLAISVPTAIHLLSQGTADDDRWWDGAPAECISMRAEYLQECLVRLLHRVGAIANEKIVERLVLEYCRKHLDLIPDDDEYDYRLPIELRKHMWLNDAVNRATIDGSALPSELANLPEITMLLHQASIRHLLSRPFPDSRRWNGTIPLSTLFESEEAPSATDTYFDQRFIDYLAAQPNDISWINWRQFEYLTGEYFHRQGYQVNIGAGRKDGGVDITASKDHEIAGPELIVVQCRRYHEDSPIGVEAIRAFWATINDRNATRGLIATTSTLTKGARDYCDARRYRLNGADHANVYEWIRRMRKAM